MEDCIDTSIQAFIKRKQDADVIKRKQDADGNVIKKNKERQVKPQVT